MEKLDKEIIYYLSKDIDITKEPYKELSSRLNISQEEIINRIKVIKEKGYLKRISPLMRHKQIGYNYNVMIVWNIPSPDIKNTVNEIKNIKNVSHMYERQTNENWQYNFFTMIHAQSIDELNEIVENLVNIMKTTDYKLFKTVREWKKSSPNVNTLI